MRNYLMFFILILVAGCSSRGDSGYDVDALAYSRHVPFISVLSLTPSSVFYMEGDGQVDVTVEMSVRDTGLDVQTLWIRMPDGTTIEFDETANADSTKLAESFKMSTDVVDRFTVEVWVADKAGDSSNHLTADFDVVADVQSGNWTKRLGDLPYPLNDVIWDGQGFIAVGDIGFVLTSDDGITWSEQKIESEFDLNALASWGPEIIAVGGDGIVLRSTDHGVTWAVKHSAEDTRLAAVAVTASQIVVGGMDQTTGAAVILVSDDHGDTWTDTGPWPADGYFPTDFVYHDGRYVGATDVFSPGGDARVLVSNDGKVWNEIILRDEVAASYAILHDGQQFVAAGSHSAVFTSPDGYNWVEHVTPVQDVTYVSAAWNGSELLIAGGISWWYWWGGTSLDFERPLGLSTTDGGKSWQFFNIDGDYESHGMAWGNGRFVSVGCMDFEAGMLYPGVIATENAIYTSP
jgi:photosystem II stability/assembly factor-like uncharacterized protein